MRACLSGVAAFCAIVVTGCAIVAQQAAKEAGANVTKCFADSRATPEGQLTYSRLWKGDGTDTAAKLSDPKPLTPPERDALVQVHNRIVQCRQIIIAHDNQYAAWETPIFQEAFDRSDQIFLKLASGEIPVGLANRLYIESNGKLQVDLSKGHADAVRVEEARQQRAAEAMLQASAQIAASQPRMSTTNCNFFGNTLNCTTMH
jgi:hypothetical protein